MKSHRHRAFVALPVYLLAISLLSPSAKAQADSLPSWNDGAAKAGLLYFTNAEGQDVIRCSKMN